MNSKTGLSLTQAPPISVPLRFFLTAPLFGLAAAILFFWFGPAAIETRWSPVTLAITHLLTLGFLLMAIIGAMMQMLPVMVGSPLNRPRVLSTVVHVFLCLGLLALACGFLFTNKILIIISMPSLAAGLLVFAGAAGASLMRAATINATVTGMRLSVAALVVTLVLALIVSTGHAWSWHVPKTITNVHMTWGLVGTVSLLIIGVAYEVVPMFQMTPAYPGWMKRRFTTLLFIGLLLWSALYALQSNGSTLMTVLADLASSFLALWLLVFAVITYRLQGQRKRRTPDVSVHFWRTGLICLGLCAVLWVVSRLWPALDNWPRLNMLLGVLMIVGFAVSVINAMLYKIAPFLVWLHSQHLTGSARAIPNMNEIISKQNKLRHFLLHLGALLLLMMALIWPSLSYPSAFLFILAFAQLCFNLHSALRIYLVIKRNTEAAAS